MVATPSMPSTAAYQAATEKNILNNEAEELFHMPNS